MNDTGTYDDAKSPSADWKSGRVWLRFVGLGLGNSLLAMVSVVVVGVVAEVWLQVEPSLDMADLGASDFVLMMAAATVYLSLHLLALKLAGISEKATGDGKVTLGSSLAWEVISAVLWFALVAGPYLAVAWFLMKWAEILTPMSLAGEAVFILAAVVGRMSFGPLVRGTARRTGDLPSD